MERFFGLDVEKQNSNKPREHLPMPLHDPPERFRAFFHRCGKLPSDGVDVVYSSSDVLNRPPCWVLTICREATESDLEENHILEEVGESIWTVTLEITNYPYCGESLQAPDLTESEVDVDSDSYSDEDWAAFGAFSNFDQEKWSGRHR